MQRAMLDALIAARTAGRAVLLVTPLDGMGARLLTEAEVDTLAEPLRAVALAALREDIARRHALASGEVLLTPFNPRLRLIIVGAVHIAQPLARMAALAEYAVTLVDPRLAFTQARDFAPAVLRTDWPDTALTQLAPDARTAVVTLAHDPKIDDPALQVALASRAFYIGALGSSRTHARRLQRLTGAGLTAAQLARIDGPAGLRIAARTPAEIAIAVLGRMTQIIRRKV
ncbi:MAG: XdhC family protein [Steroidobacteraceae bacterium]